MGEEEGGGEREGLGRERVGGQVLMSGGGDGVRLLLDLLVLELGASFAALCVYKRSDG